MCVCECFPPQLYAVPGDNPALLSLGRDDGHRAQGQQLLFLKADDLLNEAIQQIELGLVEDSLGGRQESERTGRRRRRRRRR